MKAHGDWRQLVLARVERAEHEVGAAGDRADHVRQLLGSVRNAAETPGSLRTWWTGSLLDKAWLELHEAEAEIPELLSEDELHVHGEEVLKESKAVLGRNDPQVSHLSDLLRARGPAAAPEAMVAETAHLTRAVYDKKDEAYAQSRTFRNRLIRLTGISVIGVALLIVAEARWTIDLNSAGTSGIPGGWETPLMIALFGAIGAFVSSIPALSRVRGTRNPFNLPLYQLLLKLTTGPLFAFVGIIMLQSGVITQLTPATTLLELLVWATVFGSTQQAVTRLVDQRVRGIVSDASGSSGTSEGSQDLRPRGRHQEIR